MFENRIMGNGMVVEGNPGKGALGARFGEEGEVEGGGTRARNGERDGGGRFLKGNKGGTGNPFARQVALMRQAFLERATPERMRRIADKFLEMAEAGNVQAGKLVLSYILGKPAAAVNPDRLDAEEWAGYQETSAWMEEAPALMTRPGRELPLKLVRGAQEDVARERGGLLGEILKMGREEFDEAREILKENPAEGIRLVGAVSKRENSGSCRLETDTTGPSANGKMGGG